MWRSAPLVFTVAFLCALALYLSTAAPTLTWAHDGADGGDLITAAVTNGIPHPPGYPTYVTLGHVIARVPVGDVAYRFNLFSAVCLALAAGLTALNLWRLITPSPALPRFSREGVAMVASLCFATAPLVWGQAIIAEVYALNAGFVALIVYVIAPIVFHREFVSVARVTLAAWLWGVAFGDSITVAALTPLMIVAWWRYRAGLRLAGQPGRRSYKPWLPILAFLAGLSVYALIPLRAAQQPPVNWGDATTLERFGALITAELYHGYLFSTAPAEFLTRLIASAQLIVTQYGWLGAMLGAAGIYYALVSPNRNWWWLAATIAFYWFFALSYSTSDSVLYLIPAWMFGAWAIARGLLAAMRYASRFTHHAAVVVLLLAFLFGPALNVAISFPTMNLRNDQTTADYANAVLAAAPPNAIVVTENDRQTFALWYHRHVAGQRPDLAVVDRRLAGYPWYAAMLSAQGSAPLLPDYDPQDTWVYRLAQLNPRRALCIVDQSLVRISCQP